MTHESLEAEANANTVRLSSAFNLNFESAPEEVRVVIQRADCETFVAGHIHLFGRGRNP